MWIEFPESRVRRLRVTTEHILGDPSRYRPVRTQIVLSEKLESAGSSATRLCYQIEEITARQDASGLKDKIEQAQGACFEAILNERGCILGAPKPAQPGPGWLIASLSEDIRTAWSLPIESTIELGTTWKESPTMPRSMPEDVRAASARALHRVVSLTDQWLEIESAFELSLKLRDRRRSGPFHGGGKQHAKFHKSRGLTQAQKETKILVSLESGPEPAAILSMELAAID